MSEVIFGIYQCADGTVDICFLCLGTHKPATSHTTFLRQSKSLKLELHLTQFEPFIGWSFSKSWIH